MQFGSKTIDYGVKHNLLKEKKNFQVEDGLDQHQHWWLRLLIMVASRHHMSNNPPVNTQFLIQLMGKHKHHMKKIMLNALSLLFDIFPLLLFSPFSV